MEAEEPKIPPVLEAAPPAQAPAAGATASACEVRIWSAVVFVISAAILGIGAYMTPSPRGLGTHAENLHLPPCGMYVVTGIPCPTCGCTTAVTWLAHGHLLKAIVTQPFGAAVGLAAVAGAFLGLVGLATGRWTGPSMFFFQWHWPSLMIGTGLLLLAGWVYKIYAVKHGF